MARWTDVPASLAAGNRMPAAVVAILSTLLLADSPPVRARNLQGAPSREQVVDGLTRYAAGQHGSAIEAFERHFAPAAAFEALVAHRDSWISTEDVGPRASQRLVLASLILELAAPPVIWDGVEVHGEEWHHQRQIRRDMVAFAGAILVGDKPASQVTSLRLRQTPTALGPARAEERDWFEAAFAVLRSHGFGGLIGLPVSLIGETGHNYPLVALAETRFPGQPWVQMAQAAAEEHFGWRAAHTGALNPDAMQVLLDPARQAASRQDESVVQRERLRRSALQSYEKLIESGAVGREVRLRAGYLRLLQRDYRRGREHFSHLTDSADPKVQFMAHLLTGWSWEREGRLPEAEAAYRAATALKPHARSSAVLLATVLVVTGRRAEAERLAPALLASGEDEDPWNSFMVEGGPSWESARDALRRALPVVAAR